MGMWRCVNRHQNGWGFLLPCPLTRCKGYPQQYACIHKSEGLRMIGPSSPACSSRKSERCPFASRSRTSTHATSLCACPLRKARRLLKLLAGPGESEQIQPPKPHATWAVGFRPSAFGPSAFGSPSGMGARTIWPSHWDLGIPRGASGITSTDIGLSQTGGALQNG